MWLLALAVGAPACVLGVRSGRAERGSGVAAPRDMGLETELKTLSFGAVCAETAVSRKRSDRKRSDRKMLSAQQQQQQRRERGPVWSALTQQNGTKTFAAIVVRLFDPGY